MGMLPDAGWRRRTGEPARAVPLILALLDMNICHIVTSLEMGGMERVLCNLLAAMGQTPGSEDVPVLNSLLFCTDAEGALYESSVVAARACGYRRPRPWVVDLRVVLSLVRFLRQHKVDCIHAHNHVAHLYAVLAGVFLRIPVVLTLHGQGFYDTPRTLKLRRLLTRWTSAVAVVSQDAGSVVAKSGAVPESKIVVVPNGVDTSRFRPRLDGEGCAIANSSLQDAITIGTVGRLSKEKNIPMLIDAFALLRKRLPALAFRLLIVGDGPERVHLEERIRRLEMVDVCQITGMVSDVRPWLQEMDIFCLSSDTEGLSISLLEACACGVPAVVTDVGGNREVVEDGKTGVITEPRDPQGFAAALGRLAADTERRSAMGRAARALVLERFSLERMAREYCRIYEVNLWRYN